MEHPTSHTSTPVNPNCRLYIGNIGFSVTTEEMRQHFSVINGVPCTVQDVFMPLIRNTQRHRGIAFIQMSEEWMATSAVDKLNGAMDPSGRPMTVRIADVRKERTADVPLADTINHDTYNNTYTNTTQNDDQTEEEEEILTIRTE